MAGLRLGLAFARKDIIDILSRVKYPYNINVVTQQLVIQQLCKQIKSQVLEIQSQRKLVEKELSGLQIVKHIFPSDANFILVRVENPKYIYTRLIEQGIIVRDRSSVPGCEGCLRITIGTPEENQRMIHAFKELV
jgi:histidinol-phosphate aminotransferase